MSVVLPTLTLRAVRTTAVHVPMRRPLGTSARRMSIAPLVLIDLDTEEGVTGRSYLFCYVPAATRGIAALVEDGGAQLVGTRLDPAAMQQQLTRHFRLLAVSGMVTMAISGLDGACWDALAQAAGVPLARLLGASRPRLPAYNSNGLGLMDTTALGDEAAALVAEGFSAIKLRLGYPTAAGDLAALEAVRARVPESTAVLSDYNQALTVDEALARGRALDGNGLVWIEEPIAHDDYVGCARLAAAIDTPIQIGENFDTPSDMARAIAAHASDHVMPDFGRILGVTGWLEAAAYAQRAGLPISSHLYPEFSVHLLAASQTAAWLEYVDWAAPILDEPLRVHDGHLAVPDRPGVGLAWNRSAVARYRVD